MLIDYKNRKAVSQEEMSQKDVELKVNQAKLQLESDILATEQSKAEIEEKLTVAKTTFPLDALKIIDLQVELEAYEDGLRRLKNLKAEFEF